VTDVEGGAVGDPASITTFLFTDVEGSTRLWEREPERMRPALAQHDAITRSAVEANRGNVVKTTGDGMHAAFADPLDALGATLRLQLDLRDVESTQGLALRVRCGLHSGAVEARDGDYFGPAVNRAARIMGAAHGGQVLLSQAVAERLRDRLPAEVALRDLGAVRLRDLASPERVYQLLHPQLRQEFPALRSLEATPNNLPQQVSSFVGRDAELRSVRRLLGDARLLTLTGVGGLGKTRLALQLAADAIEEFPDGVWFVDLAPVVDAPRVAQEVATVLGIREVPGGAIAEALAAHVKDRRLMIVLDNCEHLLAACAALARVMLQSGPGAKVLATSREPLRVAGEVSHAVPPLGVPEEAGAGGADNLEAFEAVRLFAERARAVQPGFRITPQNAPSVAAICRQLDGIPLALELAAARVRALSAEFIAARLGDRFRILTRGDRTALPRQQSLRAMIDWSYDLLTAPERAVLRRLSIFAGGWSLESAEAVCAEGEVDTTQVLDLLSNLVDKSLVIAEPGGERYRLLETVRQYARERLEEAREKRPVRERHLAHYLALAEQAMTQLTGPRQGEWLSRLDAERENLVAAHRWCERAFDGAQAGLRLLNAVKLYWFMRGLLGLGLRLTVEALARPGAQPRNAARCRGLFTEGQILAYAGRYDEAVEPLQHSLSIARELADEGNVLAVLQPLTLALAGKGEITAAKDCARQALELARRSDNKHQLLGAINSVAQLHRAQREFEAAEPLYEEVVALAREIGDRENIAIGLLNRAMVAVSRGAQDFARELLVEIAAIALEIESMPVALSALEVCAGLAACRADWASSARFYGAAEAQSSLSGIRRDPTDEAFLAPWIDRSRKALGAAEFAAFEAEGRALRVAEAIARARAWLDAGDRY